MVNFSYIKKASFIAVLLFISSLPSCCCFFKTPEEPSATELYTEGQKAFEKKKYNDAIKKFEKLINWYPFDSRATEVELKIADAHFFLEDYKLAVFEYEEYEKMHPASEHIPYVIFKTGLAYYNQIRPIDRNPEHAKKALALFVKYLKLYPNSKEKESVNKKKKECLEKIAGHEMYVGKFYLKNKKYKAALGRFEEVLIQYPDTSYQEDAKTKTQECKNFLSKKE